MVTRNQLHVEDDEIRSMIDEFQTELSTLIELCAHKDALPPGLQSRLGRLFDRIEDLLLSMKDHFDREESFLRSLSDAPRNVDHYHAHAADHARLFELAYQFALDGTNLRAGNWPLVSLAKLNHGLSSHGEYFDRAIASD